MKYPSTKKQNAMKVVAPIWWSLWKNVEEHGEPGQDQKGEAGQYEGCGG